MSRLVRPLLGAVAVAAAFLMLSASAASATPVVNLTVGTGSLTALTAGGGSPLVFSLGSGGGAACLGTATVQAEQNNPAAGSFKALAFASKGHFTLGGVNRMVTLSLQTGTPEDETGTFGSGAVSNVDVGLQAALVTDANADCVPDGAGTPVCTYWLGVNLNGTYTGTGASAGDTYSASVASTATKFTPVGTCNAPFSTYNGGSVSGTFSATV